MKCQEQCKLENVQYIFLEKSVFFLFSVIMWLTLTTLNKTVKLGLLSCKISVNLVFQIIHNKML